MSLEEFCLLSNQDQFETVFQQGTFSENYSTSYLKFNLCSIDKFYHYPNYSLFTSSS